ncbi:MAG: hypothetical protein ACM3X6_06530 [Patescibacteria group bacterium]
MKKRLICALSLLLLPCLAGCGRPVELYGIRRVAILALDNYTARRQLGAEIGRELMAQIPVRLAVEVIDGAAVEAGLPTGGAGSLLGDPGLAAGLGQRFGVDAFLCVTAVSYREFRDRTLDLSLASGEGLGAAFVVKVGVEVVFDLRLVLAADGSAPLYRQSAAVREERLVFDLTRPYRSFALSIEPCYRRLREEAVHEAVAKLIAMLRREYGV